MKTKLIVPLLGSMLFALAAPLRSLAATNLIYEGVVYHDTHDPNQLVLKDGRTFCVKYGELTWEEVNQWTADDHRLILSYSEDQSAALVDTVTNSRLPIVEWPDGEHPIDLLLSRDLKAEMTTPGIADAYARAANLWAKEIKRAYAILQASSTFDKNGKRALKEASRAWEQFLTKHLEGIHTVFRAQEGTMWNIRAAEYRYRLIREQATVLMPLLALCEWAEIKEKH